MQKIVYKGDLNLGEIITQMLQYDTLNCELTFTINDLHFTIDLTIIKIIQSGKLLMSLDDYD